MLQLNLTLSSTATASSMNEQGHYPPPDFGCPPPNTIQPFQQPRPPPRTSSFHPSMWNWCDASSEPSWDYSGQAGWHRGAAPTFGDPSGRVDYGPKRPYGEYVWNAIYITLIVFNLV